MRYALIVLLLLFSAAAFAADSAADRAALLKIHTQEREGHLKGDAAMISAALAPSVLEVRGGHVETMDRSKAQSDFADYFKKVKYLSWDDVSEPVVKISPDGQIAWIISQVKYEVAAVEHPDQKQAFFNSSIETFERGPGGVWEMTAIAASAGR